MSLQVATFVLATVVAASPATVTHHTRVSNTGSAVSTLVKSLLPYASKNFAGIRGAARRSQPYYVTYKLNASFACPKCKVQDVYAVGKRPEKWSVYFMYDVPGGLTQAQIEAQLRPALTALLHGFKLQRSTSYIGPTLLWSSANGTWVNADIWKSFVALSVGHTLSHPQHVFAAPTQAQLKALEKGAMRIASSGISEAPTNFASLRGVLTYKTATDMEWAADPSLQSSAGSMFRDCKVSSIGVSSLTTTARWVLSCETVPLAGTKAALLTLLHDAVANVLTSDFTPTTDRQYLVMDDYRWDDRSHDSVQIGCMETDGVVRFSISIYHFIPNDDGQ